MHPVHHSTLQSTSKVPSILHSISILLSPNSTLPALQRPWFAFKKLISCSTGEVNVLRVKSGMRVAQAASLRLSKSGRVINNPHSRGARARRATGPRLHSTALSRPAPPATLLSIHTDKSRPEAARERAHYLPLTTIVAAPVHRLISAALQIR